jgi:hypothetical protein
MIRVTDAFWEFRLLKDQRADKTGICDLTQSNPPGGYPGTPPSPENIAIERPIWETRAAMEEDLEAAEVEHFTADTMYPFQT